MRLQGGQISTREQNYNRVQIVQIVYMNTAFDVASILVAGQRHVNHPPIDHPYKCHENTNHSRVPQLSKAPIHQEMKVRSQPVANTTKKHGGMQHPRPVVPTKSGHSKSDRR